MNKVANFEKVSLSQFQDAILQCSFWGFNDLQENEHFTKTIYEDIALPARATKGSAGDDFIAPFGFTLCAGESVDIPTGIRCRIDDGWVLMLYPRSGLGVKYRAQLDNTTGVIDSDYYGADNEGHIHIRLTNDSKQDKVLAVNRGDKIVQGVFLPYGITEDDAAEETRTGGMGSTGK